MDLEQSAEQAESLMADAGWQPHPDWGNYCRGELVAGVNLRGQLYIKNWAMIRPGDARYSADTPDEPHEAAAWLIAQYGALPAPPPQPAPEPTPEPVAPPETPVTDSPGAMDSVQRIEPEPEPHETDSPASPPEEPQPDSVAPDLGDDDPAGAEPAPDEPAGPVGEDVPAEEPEPDDGALMAFARDAAIAEPAITDAEFDPALLALAAPEPAMVGGGDYAPPQIGEDLKDFAPDDFPPAEPPHEAGAFIFGDNLHQMRTAAIGLVVQVALERMPAAIDYERLSSLRNFTMGISEGRWPDNPALREELDTLEGTERLRRAIESERDAKVATLLEATREEIAVFDVGAGWP